MSLALAWPDHTDAALGCANGRHVIYRVERVQRGCWKVTVEVCRREVGRTRLYEIERVREFTTKRKAKAYARRDFERRQVVKLAGV